MIWLMIIGIQTTVSLTLILIIIYYTRGLAQEIHALEWVVP